MALMSRVTKITNVVLAATGRLEFVTVNPGDFRRKFMELDGFKGACNRPIDPNRVNQYGKTLSGICTTVVVLLEENGQTFILDGQHRIAAISTYATKPMQIAARILTSKEVNEVSDNLAAYMRGLGTQKPQGTGARLAIFRSQSPWVQMVPDDIADMMTFNYAKTKTNWVALMSAIIAAERSFKRGRFITSGGVDEPSVFDLWLKVQKKTIDEVYAVLVPWLKMAEKARTNRKVTFLTGETCLATWFLVSKMNAGSSALRHLPDRLLDYDALPSVRQARNADTAIALVAAMNYKRKPENCVTLFGDTGRGS